MSFSSQENRKFTPRQRVWNEIRKVQRGFSLVEIAFAAGMKRVQPVIILKGWKMQDISRSILKSRFLVNV